MPSRSSPGLCRSKIRCRASNGVFTAASTCLPGSWHRRSDGPSKALPTIDGYEVANVFYLPQFRTASSAAAFSTYYVEWVHTDARWRRRGLARLAIEAALDHRWDRLCATTSLHTGTRNVAHALYRSQGLTDYIVHHEFKKHLHPEPPVRPPKGITIRRATARDAAAVAAVVNESFAHLPHHHIRVADWPGLDAAYVALRGRKIVGATAANVQGVSAWLGLLAVAEMTKPDGKTDAPRRERIGRALLSATDDPFVSSLLSRCGYSTGRTGFVELQRINQLDQFCAEIAATLEACIHVEAGKARIAARRPARPSISLHGDEFAIQRIALGLATPFEEYLQLHVEVSSCVGAGAGDLLETLFPRIIQQF